MCYSYVTQLSFAIFKRFAPHKFYPVLQFFLFMFTQHVYVFTFCYTNSTIDPFDAINGNNLFNRYLNLLYHTKIKFFLLFLYCRTKCSGKMNFSNYIYPLPCLCVFANSCTPKKVLKLKLFLFTDRKIKLL